MAEPCRDVRPGGPQSRHHSIVKEYLMSVWLILLVAALIAALIGFGTAAKWLFIIAIILLVVGLIGIVAGRRTSGV
jgi:hypothetical protein